MTLNFTFKYLEISNQLHSNENIYGLGERVNTLLLNRTDTTYTIYTHDNGGPGTDAYVGKNYYGAHPFYLSLRNDSFQSHGVFLLNSNPMDVILKPNSVTYKVLFSFDIFFLLFQCDF